MMRPRRALLVLSLALAACGSVRADPAHTPRASGSWKVFRFLGGPPATGQITDTLTFDPGSDRHVRIDRNRAGVDGPDHRCDTSLPTGEAWRALDRALGDAALVSALDHPDRIPLLALDAPYFEAVHGGVTLAISDDVNSGDSPEADALRRFEAASQRILADAAATPACAGL